MIRPVSATIPPRMALPFAFPRRQIHLDFHTSPAIPDVASEFDPEAFVEVIKRAHVESVTLFAKCHHGMCYYPTKTGTSHPAIGERDLLGEMIEVLHREGIRAPIYTTVAWDEDVARRFPQWAQLHADGTAARTANADSTKPPHPGGWWFNDWVNPDYQDYIEAHVREICERYEVDGVFYDIVFYSHLAHHSDAAKAFRAINGLLEDDLETFLHFESAAQDQFCARFTNLVRNRHSRATVFYNSGFDMTVDATVGGRVRNKHMTHVEIESLPSGFWGYHHFPRLARSVGHWGRPWIGMTGRFQRMWGDFGGIKPQAALEYECFRAEALGGGNSIGDQLPPRGRLDKAAYKLIGNVYAQCEAADPFYSGSQAIPQVGVLTARHPARDKTNSTKSDEGVIQMCEETHYEVILLDEEDDLEGFQLLILPDETVVTAKLRPKLEAYYRKGGRLIISDRGGRDASGVWQLDFLPLEFAGPVEKYPTFWRTRKEFWPAFAESDRVIYSRGQNVQPSPDLEIWVDRVLPYFNRTDAAFCSHFQTPPVADIDAFPAVVAGQGFVYFADPIFQEYRETGNTATRDVWRRVMERLVGPAPVGSGLPTTVLCAARRRGNDMIITLLHYVPVRKALEIDVIEERMSFAGELLRLPENVAEVRIFGSGEQLERVDNGVFLLPSVKGRLLLEVPDYFRDQPASG